MSEAIARAYIAGCTKVTRANFGETYKYLYRRVASITDEVGRRGRYVDADEVYLLGGDCYTGEVSDCMAFVIKRGPNVLMSHIQGYGSADVLTAGLRRFRSATDRTNYASSFYLWTMPTTLDIAGWERSSFKTLITALLGAYGPVANQVLPRLTTITTGHAGVDWNGYGVAFAGQNGVGGAYERRAFEDQKRGDPYQGLKLADQFKDHKK